MKQFPIPGKSTVQVHIFQTFFFVLSLSLSIHPIHFLCIFPIVFFRPVWVTGVLEVQLFGLPTLQCIQTIAVPADIAQLLAVGSHSHPKNLQCNLGHKQDKIINIQFKSNQCNCTETQSTYHQQISLHCSLKKN